MTTTPPGSGLADSASRWSRILGVSLRPWSGTSPVKLLVSGLIQVMLCGFLIWLATRLATDDELAAFSQDLAGSGAESPMLGVLAGLIALAAVAVGILALLRLGAGAIDLLSPREVTGVVVSIGERRTLDFLPAPIAHLVLSRGRADHTSDTRRFRTELVVDTGSGVHQWRIHNQRTVSGVRRGARIRMTVTPIAGHVSRVDVLPR